MSEDDLTYRVLEVGGTSVGAQRRETRSGGCERVEPEVHVFVRRSQLELRGRRLRQLVGGGVYRGGCDKAA